MRHGAAASHCDPCCAVPKTSCITVCLVTCHSISSGQYGCEGQRFHCKSDFQCIKLCVSTMLYNCNSWAAPKTNLNKLDACHRHHLHSIHSIHWPHSTISNEALYKRCNTGPLSGMVKEARRNMLGDVLRMERNSPAQNALHYMQWRASRSTGADVVVTQPTSWTY